MQVWEIKPTDPNPRNGLRDTRCSGKQGFSDGLARSGGWWAGTPRVVTMGFSSGTLAPPPVPPWLSTMGLTIFPMSPGFIILLALFFPFLCFEFTNRMSPSENPRHSTFPLSGFSRTRILMAITSAGCHSRLVVLESGPL